MDKGKTAEVGSTNGYLIGIFGIISSSIYGSMMTLTTCKIYLLHYIHEYERILASEKWAIFIDPSIIRNNWYLNNKQKYGSSKWLTKHIASLIILAWIFIFTVSTIILVTYRLESLIFPIMFIWGVPHIIFGILCWRKYPKFNDTLWIRKEIQYTLILGTVLVVLWLVASALDRFVDESYSMLTWIIPAAVCSVYSLIVIIYPQQANELHPGYTAARKQSSVTERVIEWREVVKTMNGYEQFASFLEREFSMENILFVTEYVQLKQEIIRVEKYKVMMESELKLDYNLTLPSEIPESIIAKEFESGTMNDMDMNKKVCDGLKQLYEKYIDSSTAAMEVNISSTTKYNLTNLFKMDYSDNDEIGVEIKKILSGMETAVKEISYLMNDSTSRFRRQSVFTELMQIVS